jgi:zeaxanthin glucosyltransferase
MARILLLTYHGIGHLNPFFSIARILEKYNHTVLIAAAEFFKGYVSEQGFNYFALKSLPFAGNFERWANQVDKKENLYFAELRDRFSDRFYREREKELSAIFDLTHPDLIFIDAMLATDFIILYGKTKNRGVKFIIVHTMLPTNYSTLRPPLNSSALPGNTIEIKADVERARRRKMSKVVKQRLKFFGLSDQFLINRRIKKNNIPPTFIFKGPALLNFSLQNVPEIILAPESFDFVPVTAPLKKYIGFLPHVRAPRTIDKLYLDKRKDIHEAKVNCGRLAYCSFGTRDPDDEKLINIFYRKLVRLSIIQNFALVISSPLELKELYPLPANVFQFPSVFQPDLLEITDVFICHGGLNSIAESVEAEVPMLAYPVHGTLDTKGNAARVYYHNLGLRGNIKTDSEKEIGEKIEELFKNPKFRKGLTKMKELNNNSYRENFAEILAKLDPQLGV